VENSASGSGEGPGWATAPGYSTAAFWRIARVWHRPTGRRQGQRAAAAVIAPIMVRFSETALRA
jgi:hypothetical protein